jgi:hypothetical protein
LNKFIESFATHQVLPPWTSAGVMTWGFVLGLEQERISAYLDKYLNGAYPDRAPYVYSPLPGEQQFGLLVAARHPLLWSEYPGNPQGWDSVSATQVYLAIPVLRRPVRPDNIIVDEPVIVWVEPVMFGDNASLVFGSREIWGADMEYATIVCDEAAPGELHLDVAIEAIERFRPTSVSRLLSCLHLRTRGFTDLSPDDVVARLPQLTYFAAALATTGIFRGAIPQPPGKPDALAGSVVLNNLKQFRDVFDMGAAIYRAIVAVETSHTNVQDLRFYDCDQVEIDFMWSDSVAEMLRDIFGVAKAPRTGPPSEHAVSAPAGRAAMPLTIDANDIDWNLHRVPLKPVLGFEVRSDVYFKVLGTLYTYGAEAETPSSDRRRTSALKS